MLKKVILSIGAGLFLMSGIFAASYSDQAVKGFKAGVTPTPKSTVSPKTKASPMESPMTEPTATPTPQPSDPTPTPAPTATPANPSDPTPSPMPMPSPNDTPMAPSPTPPAI